MQVNHSVDLFEALFLSTDIYGYVGIVLLISLGIIISSRFKLAGVFFIILLIFLGVEYLDLITATGYYSFHVILSFLGAFMIGAVSLEDYR